MTTHAPDQSDRARRQITEALARGDDHIDHATARLIAATVHAGAGTALEAFAASGRFDIDLLDRELRQQRHAFPQELWRGALLGYLAWQRAKRASRRSLTPGERRRVTQHLEQSEAVKPTAVSQEFELGVKWEGNAESRMTGGLKPQTDAPVRPRVGQFMLPDRDEVVLTVAETAERLRVSHWTIYRLMREGKLRTIQIGTRRLVTMSALRAFLDDQPEQGSTGRG